MKTRRQQIDEAAFNIYNGEEDIADMGCAKFGRLCAEWADEHPAASPWISAKERKPEPQSSDGLTNVEITWKNGDFRDYATMYYAPCDDTWYCDRYDEDIPDYDYWMYLHDPESYPIADTE